MSMLIMLKSPALTELLKDRRLREQPERRIDTRRARDVVALMGLSFRPGGIDRLAGVVR